MRVLSSINRKILLEVARNTILSRIETGDPYEFESRDEELNQNCGCFVTLYSKNELRGCVGTFDRSKKLLDNVKRMSVAAAFQDFRFPALSKKELEDLRIEISVLGNLEPVRSFEDIEIGKHGVYVTLGERSGTYLPEVAEEFKWQPVEFVTYCAREKAGLAPEECARADVFRYEVEKFSEKDFSK